MDIDIIETALGYLQAFDKAGHEGGSLHRIVCSTMCEEDPSLDEDEVHIIVAELIAEEERR